MSRTQSISVNLMVAIAAHVVLFIATGLLIKYGSHPELGAATWSYRIYYDCASRPVASEVPNREFLVEYPILTFPLFLIPRQITSDIARYCFVFRAEMLLFDVAAIVIVARQVASTEGRLQVPERLAWCSCETCSSWRSWPAFCSAL
jgi:hypothetical protein